MDNKLVGSYFDFIAERVIDEDKIVTYKSLSRSLGIHVNTAKQLLYAYLTKEQSKNSFPISATFLVAGEVINGSFNITIVNESDLKSCCAKFVKVTSKHVYSIQKGKTLKEVKMLCGIDKDFSKLKKGYNLVIKCPKGIIKLKHDVKKKFELCEEQNTKVVKEALVPDNQKVNKVESNLKTECTADQTATKSQKKFSPKRNSEKGPKNVIKPAGNLANLFAKAVQKSSGNSGTKNENKCQNEPKELDVAIVNKVKDVDACAIEQGKYEKKNESKSSLKKKNKRKRIQMLSDSDEDGSNDDEKEESADLFKEKDFLSQIKNLEREEKEERKEFIPQNKKKRRKVIDRTVMNEDGYLETKKEIVFETDSENEPELLSESKDENKTKIEKGKGIQNAGAPKKQSSLLTFFKKT